MLTRPSVVICETDIEAALEHLRDLPHSENLPWSWHRKRLIDAVKKAIKHPAKIGDRVMVAPGVYGMVLHLGFDMTHDSVHDDEKRLQVILAVRAAETDLKRLTVIG